MSGLAFHLPYYATGLRADQLAEALDELTTELLRVGALEVRVYRSTDDPYRFLQVIHVARKADWEAIWNSTPYVRFRTVCGAWFQKPFAYTGYQTVSHGIASGVHDVLAEDPFAAPAPVVVPVAS